MSSPATATTEAPDPRDPREGDAARKHPPAPAGRALRVWLPLGLLVTLFALLAAFVASQADAHGRSWDEGAQDWYGEAVYQWYATRGDNQTFMRAAPELQMPQHGPFFETMVAAAQHVFDGTDRWLVRSLVGGVAGILGVAGMALCGFELGGWWLALLAAAGLAAYPRYTGAIFNNSKDVPLAVAMIFLLWLTLRLARRWGDESRKRSFLLDSTLVGICLGAALAIRVNALLWLAILGLTALTWWLRHWRTMFATGAWRRALARQASAGIIIVGFAYVTMLALWPYAALYPVDGFIDSIRSMSKYGWTGTIQFEGNLIRADQLPSRYAPEWLIIGSPVATVVFGLAGAGFVGFDLVRGKLRDLRTLLPVGLLVIPLTSFVAMSPTLYNGLRHFLFVVPGLILLGAYGLVRLWILASPRRLLATGLVVVTLLTWAEVAVSSARLYPFEYMYFSPVVGGYANARDRFEGDYWGLCQNPALAWLVDHHAEYPASSPPTVGGLFDAAVRTPQGFAFSNTPDYFVTSPYYPAPPGYVPIHTVRVHGATLCSVLINPAFAPR